MRRIVARAGMTALLCWCSSLVAAADDKVAAEVEVQPPSGRARFDDSGRSAGDERKFRDFAEVTRGAQRIDGLFTLHRKDDHLYAEIRSSQLEQPLLAPIMIARGMAMAGQPLNGDDEWILVFKRVGDRVQLIRRNIHHKAPAGSPVDKAVKQNYTDSILLALPIISVNMSNNQSVLIDLNEIFFSDFAQLGFGYLDRTRTSWHKVKAFPNNLELEVEATFGGGSSRGHGSDAVADSRGRTIVIHYSLNRLPDSSYRPRFADDRVGYFLSASKDFGSPSPDTLFVRQVNRWRIEKADPRAKLSPPKKQLIWYVENNVPHEYRPYVEAGILEWNKAFEKIGIRNALAVRWQEEGRDDFDPEDINYCTFRWITTEMSGAMSCLRANPLTGEMIDGDVIFDGDLVRYWKREYAFLAGGNSASTAQDPGSVEPNLSPVAIGRIISPIMAAKYGYGGPKSLPAFRPDPGSAAPGRETLELVPADSDPLQLQLRRRQASSQFNACQFTTGLRSEMAFAAMALALADEKDGDNEKDKDKEKEKEEAKKKAVAAEKSKEKSEVGEIRLPEEFMGQMIKMVVMHEVGHSLGLRHNFKASTMLRPDELNDTAVTRVKGMSGSVMDYLATNIAPKGLKQGDYTTTTIGPYDYWAIEYAYKPIDGDEATELKKIAARSPEPDLIFATDEDMGLNNDPQVNVWDLGGDTLVFARNRIALASELLKGVEEKVVKDGESWSRLRRAFDLLLNAWGDAAYLAAEHVGGQSVSRDHKGDKGARDPVVPMNPARQREALAFVSDKILSERAFKFSPAVLRKLASERWSHWGSNGFSRAEGVEYPINEQVLAIQKIVLDLCLQPGTLARLQNHELQLDEGTEPLRMAEVFRSMTDAVWSETSSRNEPNAVGEPNPPPPFALSTFRRNLQREHLRRLCKIVLGERRNSYEDRFSFVFFMGGDGHERYPADARSLARMHLREIAERIDTSLARKLTKLDDTTRAHLEECRHRINKVLEAGIDANEP